MAKNKRTEIQIERDKSLILENLLQGHKSQQELADLINARYKKEKLEIAISREQVRRDIISTLEDLKEDRKEFSKRALAITERRYLFMYGLAYKEYLKSQKTKTKTTKKEKEAVDDRKSYSEENVSKENQYGDPRFLAIMESCNDKIAKLNNLPILEEEKGDNPKSKVILMPSNNRSI